MTDAPAKDAPDIVAFPPGVAVGALGVAVVLEWLIPLAIVPRITVLGVVIILASIAIAGAGIRAFKAADTNVDPRKPTLVLVETGPYRFTRNPMYLGMVLLQIGVALGFGVDWAVPGAVAVWAILHWGVVLREEAYLTGKFGAPYKAFLGRTRRWL